jgi:hypothetical protein
MSSSRLFLGICAVVVGAVTASCAAGDEATSGTKGDGGGGSPSGGSGSPSSGSASAGSGAVGSGGAGGSGGAVGSGGAGGGAATGVGGGAAGSTGSGMGMCTSNAECVPAQCCHPSSCTSTSFAPNCEGIGCTAVCQGPIDCGAGHCECVKGACAVVPGP